jgi:hypothetical protein
MIKFTTVSDFIYALDGELFKYRDGWEVHAIGTSSDNYFCFYLVNPETGKEARVKVPQIVQR